MARDKRGEAPTPFRLRQGFGGQGIPSREGNLQDCRFKTGDFRNPFVTCEGITHPFIPSREGSLLDYRKAISFAGRGVMEVVILALTGWDRIFDKMGSVIGILILTLGVLSALV